MGEGFVDVLVLLGLIAVCLGIRHAIRIGRDEDRQNSSTDYLLEPAPDDTDEEATPEKPGDGRATKETRTRFVVTEEV
jgi:hypothetical protein